MSKKSILSTLLISSALLGTLSASATTSAIKPEKKLVSVEKSNAKIYKNSKLQESKTVKKGTVYKVDGYRNINSKKYYRVYQEDTKGKVVYKGYILDKDTTVLKGQKPAKKDRLVALTKDDQTAWKSLYFNKKIKTYDGTKHSSNFEVKYSYNIGGKKYFSLYRGEKWMGYMDGSAFKVLTSKTISEDKQDYKVVKDYDTYNDIYFTEKGQLKVDEKVKVKRVYTFGTGRQYGSIYNKDGKWIGYANMKALEAVETSTPDKPVTPPEKPDKPGTGGDTSKPDTKPDNPGDKPTEPGKPETPEQKLDKEIEKVKETARKVYLTKAQEDKLNDVLAKIEKVTSKDDENFKKAQEVVAKAEKDLAAQPNEKDGKALDTALKEYADFDKAKDHLTGFDAVKSAKENADKVMAELKKDAANENKATVELTGKQVQAATKALEDAFSKVKIKTDNLKKAIEDAKKAIEGKHISADDKAKVDAAIKKAEEAVKNDTLSEKNLKDILDSEKAMQEIIDKTKDIAEEKDLAALKDAVAKVSEIDKHQDVKDMISVKYNDFTAIKKDFADAKAIVEGKKTTTKAEADKLAEKLITEAKGLKLKKGTMMNNIYYAKEVLQKKDQYLPDGVANVEKAIKEAEEALANNTLENYTDFKQKSEAVLKAPSELKKNATTNKASLAKMLEEVKKLDTIKDDIASKGDKVKEAYKKAEDLNNKIKDDNEEAKKTPASEVDAAKHGLETSISGLQLNNKRLNDAIKTLTEDAKGHYLSDAQKTEATEKLGALVKAAKEAKTVKEYDVYKKAVDALVKADQEIKKAPSATAVNTIVKQYNQLKEKCADWTEGKHKEVFSPETEKPFEDALKAIEKVGKAAESKGEVTKEDLAEAEKAPQAAHNLKFNADLIDKKVNKPAEKLVAAAKTLGTDYAKTDNNQTKLTEKVKKAEEALGLQTAAEASDEESKVENVVAIRDGHWHVNGWKAIDSAEKEVVKSGKNLQKALKKPLEDKVEVAQGKLATTTEAQKQKLQEAINKAEDDLNNNRYEEFKNDRDKLVEEIQKSETNGSAEAETLQGTIEKVDKLVTVPHDDFAADQSEEISALQEAYKTAQELVKDPSTHTEKEMKEANAKLGKAAKALKLKVEEIKAKGKQFQSLVGSKGTGGEYYISTTQTSALGSSSLDTDYKAGINATTVDKYDAYKKADKELTDGIEKVKKDCPTKVDVQKARGLYKSVKESDFGKPTYDEYEKYLDAENCETIKSDIVAINKVEKAAKSRENIKKTEIIQAIQLPQDIESLKMNEPAFTQFNQQAFAYANIHLKGNAQVEAKNLQNVVKKANVLLSEPEDLLVFKKADISSTAKEPGSYTYTWNKENITKVGMAEKNVYDMAKALHNKVKSVEEEKEKNKITDDSSILDNAPALARTILTSPKANNEAKELAKIVDAGYKVDKNSTGNEEQSISKIDNNLAWNEFGANGHGSYYDALGDLQNYARNTASVTKEKLQKDAEELVDDMEDLRVLPDYLDKAMKEAQKAAASAKSAHVKGSEVETTEDLIADAKVIVEGKNDARRKLDNWDYINQLTAKLKEATKKLTTIVKK